MLNNKYTENLAKTSVKIGVNLQKDQILVINAPIETAEFAREVAKEAYDAGAKDVFIHYNDEQFHKLRYERTTEETLREVPDWWRERLDYAVNNNAAIISISAVDPDLLTDISTAKINASIEARQEAMSDYNKALMGNRNRWCVISVPTASWAVKVFPEAKNSAQALDLLWSAIIRSTHCNTRDPIAEWHEKDQIFKERSKWLNEQQFDKLHYKNELGTDLMVGLPKRHVWSGGSEKAQDGVEFFPNLPTEEIFTAPDRMRVDGRLVSSYPLVYRGKTIESFSLNFKDGEITDWCAKTNEDVLSSLIESHKNHMRLGEAALVPYDSAISRMDLLFYNTLFDENASCHFAIGSAYPGCVENGAELTEEELLEAGLNQAPNHVDFMIGTKDLQITGIKEDGTEIPVFTDGNFAF